MTTDLLPRTRELIAQSPFGRELMEFSAWLSAQHYTPFIIDQHLIRLDRVLPRIPLTEQPAVLRPADLDAAFDVERGPASRLNGFRATHRAYARFLRADERLLEPQADGPYAALTREYDDFLSEVRGLSASTRAFNAQSVADFLAHGAASGQTLSTLTPRDVEAFIVRRSRELSRHSLQHVVGHLRSFLRYCHGRGYLTHRLDNQIETPRTYRGELPPRALPWAGVQALLNSIDRQSKAGWRDYCILHLISHYGLRPSEVASLRLDSIDWENAVLHVVQHKTRSNLLLPLAPATTQILRDYLEQERSQHGSTHSELFLRVRCPSGPLRSTAICDIFDKRMRVAKLQDAAHGVYSLRHAFAMRLLGRGVGVKAIGDILGHRSIESTCSYLRLDVAALRDVALDVPGVGERTGGCHAHG